jgi:hypothetical protein
LTDATFVDFGMFHAHLQFCCGVAFFKVSYELCNIKNLHKVCMKHQPSPYTSKKNHPHGNRIDKWILRRGIMYKYS